jgi:murein DD-endopeptidase MepM/ murein hydrolase activator NlpD
MNSPTEPPTVEPQERFRQLLIDIRTQQVSPTAARRQFQSIIRELHYEYPADNVDSVDVQLVFPLKGKNYRDVGGKGRGFFGRHFDLFDHSIARSHPAHDIFIYDPDHDCIDNRTGEYADVVAVSRGMVIATETAWTEATGFKGGNYVWMYDFQTGGLWYYAHLRATYVHPGQLIEAGDKLGEVGRSGFNAAANRSDTHLHLMHLAIEPDDLPRPIDHYQWLKNARTVYKTQIPYYEPPRKKVEAYFIENKPFAPTKTIFKFPAISVASVVKIDRSRRALRKLK